MEFTYSQAKAIIQELGRFTVSSWEHYDHLAVIDTESGEFAIGNDYEAEQAWEESIESYVDECMELSEVARRYFDMEAFKKDCSYDGRGHSLSSYDGCELEIADLYAYRLN